ncbi:hypothetical protein C8R44DRAFT_848188 [Mycena epipterygia]|nr:hypothetical protein C8R44DRAFT_848188 [Mycena epipterygia]
MLEPEIQQEPVLARGWKLKRWRACALSTRLLLITMVAGLVRKGKPWFFIFRDFQSTGLYEFPSQELFINETDINRVANRSDVVQPLVGLNDTFDIAVSVLQLATSTESWERKRLLWLKKMNSNILADSAIPQFFIGGNATPEEEDGAFRLHSNYLKWYDQVETLEKSIFSDIVFRGLRLSDTDIDRNVTFQIPTQVFNKHLGTNYDLRASFVIIPHSPSPLDHLKNYTSWVPVGAKGPRTKSLPFPLTSPTDYYWTPADRLLNAFAITIPLLERHEVARMCPRPTNESVEVDEEILEKHPHVITRTHLHVARESRLFRRDAFLDKHEYLRKVSCGQMRASVPGPVDRNLCWKKYLRNGNWETMVQLMVPDSEAAGGFREENAYTPYMDVLRSAAGPKFQSTASGVNRWVKLVHAQDHMNITWHLSYSGVIPLTLLISDVDNTPLERSHYSESDYTRAQKHDAAEIHGDLFHTAWPEDSHPRRRLALHIVNYVASSLRLLLDCEYWASRKTIAYISVLGALCVAVGDLLTLSLLFYHKFSKIYHKPPTDVALTVFQVAIVVPLGLGLGLGLASRIPRPFLVLRAISPVEFFRGGTRLLPRLRWVRLTHQERASARLDARTDWRLKSGIFAGLLIVNYTLPRRFLVAPQHQKDDSSLFKILETSLSTLGWILQLILNYRAKVYAGRYKAAVLLSVVLFLTLESSLPWILGRAKLLEGVSYADLVSLVVLVLNCWQVWRYSSRIPEDEGA